MLVANRDRANDSADPSDDSLVFPLATDMSGPSKKTAARLRAEAARPELWERVEGFTRVTRPTALRLTPTLAKRLTRLATFHGVDNAETVAKRWLAERIDYELDLIEKAQRRTGL